jgi:hypothetical protein
MFSKAAITVKKSVKTETFSFKIFQFFFLVGRRDFGSVVSSALLLTSSRTNVFRILVVDPGQKKESAKLRVFHSLIEFLQVAYKLG